MGKVLVLSNVVKEFNIGLILYLHYLIVSRWSWFEFVPQMFVP